MVDRCHFPAEDLADLQDFWQFLVVVFVGIFSFLLATCWPKTRSNPQEEWFPKESCRGVNGYIVTTTSKNPGSGSIFSAWLEISRRSTLVCRAVGSWWSCGFQSNHSWGGSMTVLSLRTVNVAGNSKTTQNGKDGRKPRSQLTRHHAELRLWDCRTWCWDVKSPLSLF